MTTLCTLLLSHPIAITPLSRIKWCEWCCHKPRLVRQTKLFTCSICSIFWRKQWDRVSGTSALTQITNHTVIVPHSSLQHVIFSLFVPYCNFHLKDTKSWFLLKKCMLHMWFEMLLLIMNSHFKTKCCSLYIPVEIFSSTYYFYLNICHVFWDFPQYFLWTSISIYVTLF